MGKLEDLLEAAEALDIDSILPDAPGPQSQGMGKPTPRTGPAAPGGTDGIVDIDEIVAKAMREAGGDGKVTSMQSKQLGDSR